MTITRNIAINLKQAVTYGALFAFVLVSATTASASIEMPEMPQFTNSSGMSDCTPSSGAASKEKEAVSHEQQKEAAEFLRSHFALQTSPLNGGSTGTTSSSSVGGISSFAIDHHSSDSLTPDTAVLSWLVGERKLQIPDPPGNDLLRPPQVV